MNKIEAYIPAWLRSRIKQSVANVVKYGHYEWQRAYWRDTFSLGLHYFDYYYSKEVIARYIEDHGPWGKEQDKQARKLISSGG